MSTGLYVLLINSIDIFILQNVSIDVAEKVVYVKAPRRERAEKIDINVFIDSALAAAAIAVIYFVGWPLAQKFMKGEIKLPDLSNLKLPQLGGGGGGATDADDSPTGTTGGGTPSGTGDAITGGTMDSSGIKIPYAVTGKTVKLNVGGKHANGDRYNANHSFQNYYVVAYYKTASGQELLEMKTDGPNHSGCSSLPKCMWAEPSFELKGGGSHISSEYPHPKNHSAVSQGFEIKKIPGNWGGKVIGYGVAAYNNSQGFRVYDQWVDTGGLVGGKPANNWVRTIHGANTGQLMPNPKRALPVGGRGLEAEIRCHGGHGTSMSLGKIIEIKV